MILLIEISVGFMLKILKSGLKLTAHKDEFNAIRHGDYGAFLGLVNGSLPFMLKWSNGIITDESNNPNFDCDFEGLSKSGPSLKLFYEKCTKAYGTIVDNDIPDDIYYKVVTFEIALRMHANNYKLLNKEKRYKLSEVIDILCKYKSISLFEKQNIHRARQFLNMIKHRKPHFESWSEGIRHFLIGYSLLEKHKILII